MKNGKQMDNKHIRVTLQLEVCSICSVVSNAHQLQIEQLPITVSLACVYSPIVFFCFCFCWVFPWKQMNYLMRPQFIMHFFIREENWFTFNKSTVSTVHGVSRVISWPGICVLSKPSFLHLIRNNLPLSTVIKLLYIISLYFLDIFCNFVVLSFQT